MKATKKPAAKRAPAKSPVKAKAAAKKAPAKRRAPAATRGPKLGVKGWRLWDAYRERVDGERGLVLLEEAARIADRLDKLDALLRGDADVWCSLMKDDVHDGSVVVRVDAPLVEARQQANVLRQIVASLPLKERDDGDDDGWLDGMSA